MLKINILAFLKLTSDHFDLKSQTDERPPLMNPCDGISNEQQYVV